tara:strand:- start:2349 stop:2891 length:543 start_codon:yes stop_codon:yes gene_type:complete
MNNNIIKGISVGLGTLFVASNFYTITLLSKKSNLPMFDLPVSKYSTYEIEADMQGYRIRHRMHDPRIIGSVETSKKPAGFLGASKALSTKETQRVAGEKDVTIINNDELTAKQIACIKERAKGESTGQLIGTSVATGTGLVTSLSNVPMIGWFLSGFATNTARREGGKLGGNMASDFNDC